MKNNTSNRSVAHLATRHISPKSLCVLQHFEYQFRLLLVALPMKNLEGIIGRKKQPSTPNAMRSYVSHRTMWNL